MSDDDDVDAFLDGPPGAVPLPERIQLRRTKGWRKPEAAIVVTRPGKWGNPWRVGDTDWTVLPSGFYDKRPHPPLTREEAVTSFRNSMSWDPEWVAVIRRELAGRDLACWCPLVDALGNRVACHADVLLELANNVSEETA